MHTECSAQKLLFQPLHGRKVEGDFDGGMISTEGGALVLREVAQRTGLLERFAACFEDFRDPELIEHTVSELVSQRIYGLALGYDDLNDHDELRIDWLLSAAVGKHDLKGERRRCERDRGKPLAGKSTLNRLELTLEAPREDERYKKILSSVGAIDRFMVDEFIRSQNDEPERLILDLDATNDPVHGSQEGRFFQGYYQEYCFLPLYIFCGDAPLCARLRTADIDACEGAVEELERIVVQLRERWPNVRLIARGDSGFARDEIMSWCEENEVDYVFGLQKNPKLISLIEPETNQARIESKTLGVAARRYGEFGYRTRETWSRFRRVIGKAEHLPGQAGKPNKSNPRFVVTSLSIDQNDPQSLYETRYCPRGDMENRIKEQQLGMFADRTSTHYLKSNQTRLYFSTVAYMLLAALRRLGLKGTKMAQAQCSTIRVKLLKIGAVVKISVRRVFISLSGGYPYKHILHQTLRNLQAAAP